LGTRLVTDAANGEEVTLQLILPFGTMQPFGAFGGDNSWQHATKNNPSQKRFTSYDLSNATGLHYAVNRFYSSQQGRFTQVDPLEMGAVNLDDPQSLNMYGYCRNDPINHLDPYGLFFGFLKKLFKWVLRIAAVVLAVVTIVAAVPLIGISFTGGQVAALFLGAAALGVAGWTDGKLGAFISAGLMSVGGIVSGAFGPGIIKNFLPSGGRTSAASVIDKALIGVFSVASFTDKPPKNGGKTRARQRKVERRELKRLRERLKAPRVREILDDSQNAKPRIEEPEPNPKVPGRGGEETFGREVWRRPPPPPDAPLWTKIKYNVGLGLDWLGTTMGGGPNGAGWTIMIIVVPPGGFCQFQPMGCKPCPTCTM
jgi:RHS repeat-associated protein